MVELYGGHSHAQLGLKVVSTILGLIPFVTQQNFVIIDRLRTEENTQNYSSPEGQITTAFMFMFMLCHVSYNVAPFCVMSLCFVLQGHRKNPSKHFCHFRERIKFFCDRVCCESCSASPLLSV